MLPRRRARRYRQGEVHAQVSEVCSVRTRHEADGERQRCALSPARTASPNLEMMRSLYAYGLLLPARAVNSEVHNRPLLGARTLGIEVTEPVLAARCGLGNIDPQHGSCSTSSAPAAIEVCLDHPLPPGGARLVTIRPDLDALGGMTLLTLRARDEFLSADLVDRVHAAARADKFDRGAWPGARRVPATADEIVEAFGDGEITALAAACADDAVSPRDRVETAARWLLSGTVPLAYLAAPRQRTELLLRALREGRIEIGMAAEGRIAVVTSEAPGALRLGYFFAPVVVACNPAHPFKTGNREICGGRKYTIAQWEPGHVALDLAVEALNRREPGWGGSATIKGSPQSAPSNLTLEAVVAVVERMMAHSNSKSSLPTALDI